MAVLPDDINICYLDGDFLAAVIDGFDADTRPDGVSYGGLNVKVRALPKDLPVAHRASNKEIRLADIDTITDTDGSITDGQGNKWIAFVAPSPSLTPAGSGPGEPWKVTVTLSGPGYTTRSKTFVPLATTPEEPLRWTDILEVTPSNPAELEALQAVLAEVAAGRAAAEAAAAQAAAFGGTNNEQVATYVTVPGPSREAVLDVLADGVPSIVAEAIADDPSVVSSAASLAQSEAGLALVSDFVNAGGLYAFPGAAGTSGAAVHRIAGSGYSAGTSLEGQTETLGGAVIVTRPTDGTPRGAWTSDGTIMRSTAGSSTVPMFVPVGQSVGVSRCRIGALRPIGQAQGIGAIVAGIFPAANTGTVKYLRWALSGTSRVYVLQKVTGTSWYATTTTTLLASSTVAQVNDTVELVLGDAGALSLRVNGVVVASYALTSAELTEFSPGTQAGIYGTPTTSTEPGFRSWEWAPSLPVISRKMVTAGSDGSLPALVDTYVKALITAAGEAAVGSGTTNARKRGYGPQFEDVGLTLVTRAASGLPSIYTPQFYDMRGVPGWTGFDFLLFYTTDHDTGTGGVGVAGRSGSPMGTFSPIIAGGNPRVYVDTVEGNSTETAFPWYFPDDPDGKPHYLYYQQDGVGGRQSTLLAKTANPTLSTGWTRVGVVMSKAQSNAGPGDGQTTYPALFALGDGIGAITIDGGGSYGGKILSRSVDGLTWVRDPHRFADRTDLTGDTELRFVPSGIFRWRSEWWMTLSRTGWGSGLWGSTDARPYVARLSDDLKSIISKPRPMFAGNVMPSGVTEIGSLGAPTEIDGYLYVPYRANGATSGTIRLMRAKA